MIFKKSFIIAAACCWFIAGCGQKASEPATATQAVQPGNAWHPPAAGQVVAQYEERITGDQLNEKYFRVTVLATEGSAEGRYRLRLGYGFNINEADVGLPRWTGNAVLKPVLRKAAGPYHCILGFDAGDGEFHELYDIDAGTGDVHFKKIRAYYISR